MAEYRVPQLAWTDDDPERMDRDGLLVRTPYSEAFVEDLKQLVPWKDRRWLPHEKVWWCAADHQAAIEELVLRYWVECEVIDSDGVEETRSRSGFGSSQGRLF